MTNFSRLSLYPATAEQILESRKRTFQQWGRGNTLEEYLEREETTDRNEVAQDGRLITWVLAPRDSWNSLGFLCSCETFRRNALSIKRSDSGDRTFPVDILGYGIASVFTPAANRGRGYARHMMRLLHWVLAPESSLPKVFPAEWGDPPPRVSAVGDASFSALFSDIGEDFYRQTGTLPNKEDGWVVADPVSTAWNVAECYKLLRVSTESRPHLRWKWLDEELVRDIWDKDAAIMKEEFSSSSTHTTNFTFLPDRGVAEFQYERLRFVWSKMNPQPIYWGVCGQGRKDESASDASTFATWTLEVRPPASNALVITRIRVQPTDFEELLLQIVSFARQHSIEMIEVWNLPSNLRYIAHRIGGKTFSRDGDHLPSFKWYGGERREELSWLNNERFCWC